jgi:NAD(P)H dehydrogenase (quinone)
MPKALVCYYSRTGHTAGMAEKIAGVLREEGLETDLRKVEETPVEDLPGYHAVVLGSPVYYGGMAWPMKKFLDESVGFHGRLAGKVGGAFSSSMNVGGGNETAIMDMLKALLIHGMVVQGAPKTDHYGPVAVGAPDERALAACAAHARVIARLTKALHS